MIVQADEERGFANEIGMVAIAASLGGVEALCRVLQDLPADFSAPVVVVQHLAADSPSALDRIIQGRTVLRVKWASDGERLEKGTVYLAPPNRHLTATAPDILSLDMSCRVNWVRPSADVLFASVARHFGKHAL